MSSIEVPYDQPIFTVGTIPQIMSAARREARKESFPITVPEVQRVVQASPVVGA